MTAKYFECSCFGVDDFIKMSYFPPVKNVEGAWLIISMMPDDRINFFKRLWIGMKFAFLRKPYFVEHIITKREQADDMIEFLDQFDK